MSFDFTVDRTEFARLVEVALRRIPTASRGNWTLHAPVDPGITLVELFAWLLEQRSYWADQATAPLVRAVMRMFGDTITGARPAGAVITFDPGAHAEVARRTALFVPETDIVFTLRHGLVALALAHHPGGRPIIELDRVPGHGVEDLRTGRPVPLLRADGGPSEARIGITLDRPSPTGVTARASILIELDTTVRPQWHPEAVAVQPPAVVRWEYADTNGAWQPLPQLHDGTLGLRRSGLVRFAVPVDWSASAGAAPHVGWLRVITDAATFSSPPVVLRIAPNTAMAIHYEWTTYTESPGWLPLPARTIALPRGPLPLPDRVRIQVAEPSGPARWRVVPDLGGCAPAERVAIVDRERASVVFGDGLTGRVPRLDPNADPQVTVHYARGGGRAGNLPPQPRWEALDLELPPAHSLLPAEGGRDAETLDEARTRATAALHQPTRAVTPRDHETLACTTPGVAVARAHAEVGLVLGECGVVPGQTTVFVVPEINSRTRDDVRAGTAVAAPVPDPGVLAEVRSQLARGRLVGEMIRVEPAAYRHVRLRVTVAGAAADASGVRRRVAGALRLFIDPLLGGPDGTGWPFGEPVRPSALLGVAQREIGDRGEVIRVDVTIDGGSRDACDDKQVAIRAWELISLDDIVIVLDAAPATEVGLR